MPRLPPSLGAHLPVTPLDPAYAADFDRVTRLASRMLRAPVAQFNVVTDAAQISASVAGPPIGPRTVGLDASYCQHVARSGEALVVDDARTDPLVRDNRATTESGIGAYAGVPVVLPDGTVAGVLCVIDFAPREWTPDEQGLLDDLAASLAGRLELARYAAEQVRDRAYLDYVLDEGAAHLYSARIVGDRLEVAWVSDSVQRLTGFTPAEAMAPTWWPERLHPADREAAFLSLDAVCQRGGVVREYRVRHRDGHFVWVRDEVRLVRDGRGEPTELLGSWVDISDRRAAEAALRRAHDELEARVEARTADLVRVNAELVREVERRLRSEAELERSEAHFRSLIEHSPDLIVLLDETGTFRYASPSFEHVLGYPSGGLLGTAGIPGVHPDDVPRVEEVLARLLEHPGETRRLAGRFRHADGSWRDFEVEGTNLLQHPAVGALVMNARDVTDRVAAEASLRVSEARFRSIYEQAGVGIAEVGLDGGWLTANPRLCAIVGYTEDELRARTFSSITHPEDIDADLELYQRALAGEIGHYQLLKRYLHRDGHVVWVLLTAVLVAGPTGIPERWLAVIEDVTERRQATEDVRLGQLEVLDRLAVASEYRDDDTGQHTRRVGALAGRLALALALPADQVELVRAAAPLHDIGKIAVPDAILGKPGRLTPEEFRVMQAHTEVGARILATGRSPLVQMAERIARSHHERWDGAGYPDGLAGEQIPLEARIVAVADVYDALSNDRPYRAAWPHERVVAEIAQGAGTHFDPRVVETFMRLPAESDDDARAGSGSAAVAGGV